MTDWTGRLLAPPPSRPLRPGPPPTLSVLVPAYNAADTIGETLESALSQRPSPLEVVVSDDGSEDGLEDVLTTFGDHVRVVRGLLNAGLATARNRAAAVARGDLFGLLDADDVWLPGRAAALTAAAAARPDLSIITTDAVVRDGGRDADTYYANRHFECEDQETAILRNNFIFGAGRCVPRRSPPSAGTTPGPAGRRTGISGSACCSPVIGLD